MPKTFCMKNLFTLFFLLFSLILTAQNNSNTKIEIDQRLYDVFEEDYLTNLKVNNPTLIQRWNFYLDHAWYITDAPKEKQLEMTGSVQIADVDNVNILKLEREQAIRKDLKKRNIYKIEGTNKVLVYYPGQHFMKQLNQHLERTY